MRLLLDTHVFLWFIGADAQLPAVWCDRIRDPRNEVFLRVVSVWEAMVKYAIGKLPLPHPPMASLSLDEASVRHLAMLPSVHRDLFDRMLVCQALAHGLTVQYALRLTTMCETQPGWIEEVSAHGDHYLPRP